MVEAKNKLCPQCKRELTDEETELNTKSCWYCVAKVLRKLDEGDKVPKCADYGRPNGEVELAAELQLESVRKLAPADGSSETPVELIDFTPEERKKMIMQQGIDPQAKFPITVITVKGKNDDTFIQLSLRGHISPEMRGEFERWIRGVLELVGTVSTFGPNFGSTILNMKLISPEMFLK